MVTQNSADAEAEVLLNEFELGAGLNMLISESEEPENARWNFTEEGNYGMTPIEKFSRHILYSAVDQRASDIYFERQERDFTIRLKIDGILEKIESPPFRLFEPVRENFMGLFGLIEKRYKPKKPRAAVKRMLSRWLRLRELRETEIIPKREFGYGDVASTTLRMAGRPINLNLSLLPAGDHDNFHLELFDERLLQQRLAPEIEAMLHGSRNGLVLLSSPPDNGKTTTAYQILQALNTPWRNMVALERKASYTLNGVSRIPANPGMENYGRILGAIRNYNPDVLFFDDLSDETTAREAIHYARNGKLVIASVASRSIQEGLERLASLGLKRTDLSSDLRFLVQQRLLRQVHKKDDKPCGGCIECNNSGYKGRIPVYQIVEGKEIVGGDRNIGSITPVLNEFARKGVVSETEAEYQSSI